MTMEDIDGGLHPAVDGQSLDEDDDDEDDENMPIVQRSTDSVFVCARKHKSLKTKLCTYSLRYICALPGL